MTTQEPPDGGHSDDPEFKYSDTDAVVADIKLFHDSINAADRTYTSVEGLVAEYCATVEDVEGYTFEYGQKAALVYLYRERYGEI